MADGGAQSGDVEGESSGQEGAQRAENQVAGASVPREPQLDSMGRAYASGRRKSSVARVWLRAGRGRIMVNGSDVEQYFGRAVLRMILRHPFAVAERDNQFDVMATVKGGGLSGQAGALRLAISKALVAFEPGLRSVLKAEGFLVRDARVVERKKIWSQEGAAVVPVFQALSILGI